MKSLVLGYLPVFQKRIQKYIVGQLIVVSGYAIQCGGIVVNDFAGRKNRLPRSSLEAFERHEVSDKKGQDFFKRFELDLGAATLISSIDFDIYTGYPSANECKVTVTVCGRGTEEVVKTHRIVQSKFTLNYY